MAFIPTPGAIRSALQFTYDDQLVVNTCWSHKNAVISDADLSNCNDALIAWWQANMRAHSSVQLTLNSVVSYSQAAVDAPQHTTIVTTNNVGLATNPPLPGNVAAVISFRTANRGRSSRGRMYVPALVVTDTATPNQMTATLRTALINAAVDLVGKLAFVGLQQVIVSHFFNKFPRAAGLVQPVTSSIVDTLLDSQRRRLTARGV